MATYRHWSVSLWRDPDDVSHCRILPPDKTEWWLISRLHSADEDAVSWLTNYGKWHAYEKKKTNCEDCKTTRSPGMRQFLPESHHSHSTLAFNCTTIYRAVFSGWIENAGTARTVRKHRAYFLRTFVCNKLGWMDGWMDGWKLRCFDHCCLENDIIEVSLPGIRKTTSENGQTWTYM